MWKLRLPLYPITFLKSAVDVFDCSDVCSITCVEGAVRQLVVALPQQFVLCRRGGQSSSGKSQSESPRVQSVMGGQNFAQL